MAPRQQSIERHLTVGQVAELLGTTERFPHHLLPVFGAVSLGGIDEAAVRKWRKDRLVAGRAAGRRFGR